jgi:hypothetical protein
MRAWVRRLVRGRRFQMTVVWVTLLLVSSVVVTTLHVGSAHDAELGRVPDGTEAMVLLGAVTGCSWLIVRQIQNVLHRQVLAGLAAGVLVCRVHRVRQRSRTGTKAYVAWLGAAAQQELPNAVWVNGGRVRRRECLVVRGNAGFGDHHREPVFYVNEITERW